MPNKQLQVTHCFNPRSPYTFSSCNTLYEVVKRKPHNSWNHPFRGRGLDCQIFQEEHQCACLNDDIRMSRWKHYDYTKWKRNGNHRMKNLQTIWICFNENRGRIFGLEYVTYVLAECAKKVGVLVKTFSIGDSNVIPGNEKSCQHAGNEKYRISLLFFFMWHLISTENS